MSLFSPVEALCAESIGQKLGFSYATGNSNYKKSEKYALTVSESDRKAAASASAIEEVKKDIKDGANRSPAPSNLKKPQQQLQRRPRFAPELDGVFCFETIVPY